MCPTKACDGIVVQTSAAEPPAQALAAADSAVTNAQSAAEGDLQQTQQDSANPQAAAVPNGVHQADDAEAEGKLTAEPQPPADADASKPPERPSTTWQCLQCGTAMPAHGENNSGCEQQASGRMPRVLLFMCTTLAVHCKATCRTRVCVMLRCKWQSVLVVYLELHLRLVYRRNTVVHALHCSRSAAQILAHQGSVMASQCLIPRASNSAAGHDSTTPLGGRHDPVPYEGPQSTQTCFWVAHASVRLKVHHAGL